jgi:hypothetical protein
MEQNIALELNQKNRREINYPVSCIATGFFMIILNILVLMVVIAVFAMTLRLGNKQ